jgi:hypothetical protein
MCPFSFCAFNSVCAWRAAHIFLKDTIATHRFSNSFIEVFFFKPKFKLLCMKNYVKNRMHEQCPVVFPLFQSLFFIASFSNSIPAVQRATLSPRVDFSGESASCRTLSTTAGVFSCLWPASSDQFRNDLFQFLYIFITSLAGLRMSYNANVEVRILNLIESFLKWKFEL